MTDRLLVFSHPEVQRLLREKFIPVACNDWYQRRRQDDEGNFFRSVANQGPRKGQGGSTRQGHYTLTAGGKLLGYNNNRDPERPLKMMREALKKWNQLPAAEKQPKIPAHGKIDTRFQRTLPKAAEVIKTYTRAMDLRDGKLSTLTSKSPGKLAAVDHLWIRQEELNGLKSLILAGGGALPRRLAMRIARYHLTDNTRGEPPSWNANEIKQLEINLGKNGTLKGKFHLETADGKRGYKGTLTGHIHFTTAAKLSSFQLLAQGKHWGEGKYTRGARPGKTPLCIYFEHVTKPTVSDLIPPQGSHWEKGYWQAEN